MALTITVTITTDEDQAYTTREAAVLSALQAHPSQGAAAVVAPAPAAKAAAPKAAVKTTRATPAPESAASTTPAVLDTTLDETPAAAEPEPAAEEEDLVGGTKEYTLDDAVAVATQLISDKKAAAVKAALEAAGGAKRVSELKGAAIGQFIAAAQAA